MTKSLICIFLFICTVLKSFAQQHTRYIVQFRDKGNNPYSLSQPQAYLSQRAIDRRTRYSIALDSTDLPVTPAYIDSIRMAGAVTILNVSKWLNSASILTTDATALSKINSLPFVRSVAPIAARLRQTRPEKFYAEDNQVPVSHRISKISSGPFNYGTSISQIRIHNGTFLHALGLQGQQMEIGMLDAGFYQYNVLHAFDSVRINGQIKGIYDFVAHDSSVAEDYPHGMECFSIMAANVPGTLVGTAPKANYLLFRTEDAATEYPIEEHNWVCGAERVDSCGGDVISSSLGYTQFDDPSFDHTYADMNGKTTIAARGADMAAHKGILVVNAAGNDGDDNWHYISTPADGDSVLAVGAVDTTGQPGGFSSFGPSSDGRIKPDVASVGVSALIAAPNNTFVSGDGTSFACPDMAGIVTCLWQGFPEFNNMQLIAALKQAGSNATSPNNQTGYGIPDAKKALVFLLTKYASGTASIDNCVTTLNWNSKDNSMMKYVIERKLPGAGNFITIAEKSGTGAIFGNNSYQYKDSLGTVQPGTIQYRIRQIVDTSKASLTDFYIDTLSVSLTTSCTQATNSPLTITISPNPAHDQFNLQIKTYNAIPQLTVKLIDAKGQLIDLLHKSIFQGTSTISIPVWRYPSGKYYILIYDSNTLVGTKELLKL